MIQGCQNTLYNTRITPHDVVHHSNQFDKSNILQVNPIESYLHRSNVDNPYFYHQPRVQHRTTLQASHEMASDLITGSCACRHISYTASQPPSDVTNCHCTTCRKQAGAPYQSWATFAPGSLTWDKDKLPSVRRSSAFATRGFCPKCGSSVSMKYDYEPELLSVTTGTIDSAHQGKIPKPSCYLFLQEKVAWFDMPDDGVGRWDRFSPDMAESLEKWQTMSS